MNYDQTKYPMIWKRVNSTGYRFTAHIPCRILRRAGKKIEIAASLIGGKERIHRVDPNSLVHDPCHCFAACKAIESIDGPKYVTIASDAGRTCMAQVIRFIDPSPFTIGSVILKPELGHVTFGASPEERKWSLDTGRLVPYPHGISDVHECLWRITVTDLENLRQQSADLLRQKEAGQ